MAWHYSKANSKTRFLLILWEMNAYKSAVKRRDLTKRVTKKKEKAGGYQEIFDELEQAGAIAFSSRNLMSLHPEAGMEMPKQDLQDADFELDGNVVAEKNVLGFALRLLQEKAIAYCENLNFTYVIWEEKT
jgi:hypothetical protein